MGKPRVRECIDCGTPVTREAKRCHPCSRVALRSWPLERIVAFVGDLASKLGRLPTLREVVDSGGPSVKAIYARAGSYRDVALQVGLPPRAPGTYPRAERAGKDDFGRNRQMVTGKGNVGPGAVGHAVLCR